MIPYGIGQNVEFKKNLGPTLGNIELTKLFNVSKNEFTENLSPIYKLLTNLKNCKEIEYRDLIGFVGNTGQSSGPHLHYEVFKNNRQINPVNFFFNDLSPEEYDKVIEISSRPNQSL